MEEQQCPYIDRVSMEMWYLEKGLTKEELEPIVKKLTIDEIRPPQKKKRVYRAKKPPYVRIRDGLSPTELIEYNKAQRAKYKEMKKVSDQLWLEKNPNYLHAYNHQARMRNRNRAVFEAGDIKDTMKLAEWLSKEKGKPCPYCKANEAQHIDHIIPVGKGGSHTWDNICVACDMCNKMKLDHYLDDWLEHMRIIVANNPEP